LSGDTGTAVRKKEERKRHDKLGALAETRRAPQLPDIPLKNKHFIIGRLWWLGVTFC